MSNKQDLELAYNAGRAANTEPPERRTVDACPFPIGSDERAEWLRGFQAELDEATPASLRREVTSAIKTEDKAG